MEIFPLVDTLVELNPSHVRGWVVWGFENRAEGRVKDRGVEFVHLYKCCMIIRFDTIQFMFLKTSGEESQQQIEPQFPYIPMGCLALLRAISSEESILSR